MNEMNWPRKSNACINNYHLHEGSETNDLPYDCANNVFRSRKYEGYDTQFSSKISRGLTNDHSESVKENGVINKYLDHHLNVKVELLDKIRKSNKKFSFHDPIEIGITSEESKLVSKIWENQTDRHHICPVNCKRDQLYH